MNNLLRNLIRDEISVDLAVAVYLGISCGSLQAQELIFPEEGGVKSYSKITSEGNSGEEYTFESTELVFPKNSRAFGDAAMKGTGQFLNHVGENSFLLTGGNVTSITGDRILIQLPKNQLEFQITKESRFCDGKGPIDKNKVVPGDMVVVVSHPGKPKIAATVRKGPMLVKTGGPFSSSQKESKPVNFSCE